MGKKRTNYNRGKKTVKKKLRKTGREAKQEKTITRKENR